MSLLTLMRIKEIKVVVAITLIGTLLRFFAIGQHDFWFDEAFTYHLARLPLPGLLSAVLTDSNPPLYYLIIHFILKISNSEIAIRLPSTIFSLITLVLVYATFKNNINSKVALIAASLFSVSPLALYMAGEARLHSLAMLIVVLLVMVFFSLKNKPTFTTLLVFIAVSIAGLYTQYYISLLFLPFTWIVVRYKILTIKKWFFVLVAIALPFLPWLVASAMTTHNGCSCPNTLLTLPSTLVAPAIGGVGEVTLRSFPKLPLFIFLSFAVVALSVLLLFIRGLFKARLPTSLYLIPLIIISLAGLLLPVFSAKAFAIFSPIYFAIVAIGITSYRKSGLITLLLIGLMGMISIIQLTQPFFAGTRLKPLYNIIQKNQTVPVAHTSLLTYYSLNYYSQGNQKHILITQNPLSKETLKFIGGQKQEVNTNTSQLWLVDSEKWTEKENRKNALKIIFDTYSVEKNYKVDRISVSLLKRK